MESQVKFRDGLHGGSGDVDTEYWKGAYSAKQDERERVLAFISDAVMRFPRDNANVRMLSLPGISWLFEHMLVQRFPCQFVGLEKSATLYSRSRVAMPGIRDSHLTANRRLTENTLQYGNATMVYSDVRTDAGFHAFTGRENRLLLMDAETYATVLFTDYCAPAEKKDLFNALFCRRNAVWLDYTGTLSPNVENTLRHLPFCMVPNKVRKPVVITVMNARDYYHGDQERVDRMMQVQPALEYAKHWTYVGKGGVSMLSACFYVE